MSNTSNDLKLGISKGQDHAVTEFNKWGASQNINLTLEEASSFLHLSVQKGRHQHHTNDKCEINSNNEFRTKWSRC